MIFVHCGKMLVTIKHICLLMVNRIYRLTILYLIKMLCASLQGFLTLKHIFCFCRLVLRIATDDSKAVCRLSVKFGATLKSSRLLLERAKELGLDVIGVSFHVGSGCTDPETYSQAISDARYVFDVGVSGLIALKN